MAKSNSNAERLKTELEIAKAVENASKSIQSYREAQKKIVENQKLIAVAQAELNDLAQKAKDHKNGLIKLTKKELEALNDNIDARNLEISQIKEINKELNSSKTALKAIGNQLVKNGKELLPTLGGIKNALLDVDDLLRTSAAQIGLSGQSFKTYKNVAESTRGTFAELGFGLSDNIKMMQSFADETGRQNLLSAEAANSMAHTARILGMTTDEVGQLAGQMEAFGLGALQSSETMLEIRDTAEGMGVNSGKVLKKFQQNLGLLNKLDFKGGMKGMAKMAAYSEKFKISMEAVAGVADKVFRPEGAIDAAAQLQTLGGSLSQLGDPFQLMYQARYAPEELAKSLTSAAKQSAVFNKETKEFEVNALELDRLREAASALGMDYTELVKTAKQSAKIDYMSKFLPSNMKPEDKEALLGLADMKDGKAVVTMPNGTVKALNQLTAGDRKLLLEKAKSRKELEEQSMSLKKEWEAIQNTMLSVGVAIFQPIADWLNSSEGKEWINGLISGIQTLGGWITDFIQFLGPTGTLAVIGGIFLGRMGLLKPLIGIFTNFGSWVGKLIPAMGNWVKNGVSKLTSVFSGGLTTQTTTPNPNPTGSQGGIGNMMSNVNTTDLIKGAVAITILSGALWVFAKSLQEFDKLENGWETLAMAGVSLAGLSLGLWAISAIPNQDLIEGALALALMGAAMIPFAYSLSLLQGLSWETLAMAGVALVGFTGAIFGLGAIMMTGVGAWIFGAGLLAFTGLGLALMVFGDGLSAVVEPMVLFIENLAQLGNLSEGFMALGPTLLGLSLGIATLAGSLLLLGAAYTMGGFLGLFALGETAEHLKTAFGDIDAKGISESINAINNVDMSKIDALRDLSNSMALWGMFGAKPIEVKMNVDGDIELSGEGGGKSSTGWIDDPIFVNKLKDLIAQEMVRSKTGGI